MKTFHKILFLLGRKRRRPLAILLGLICIGMVLETVGVGLFIPALAIMTERDIGAKYPFAQPFLQWLGNPSSNELIVWGLLVLVAVYAVKNVYLGFMTWWQARYIFSVQVMLSQRLFESYLSQPYAFHLRRNSAELIRNATSEVDQFTAKALSPLMIMITEGLVLLCLTGLMVLVEPVGTAIVMLCLGVVGFVFYQAFRNRVVVWGKGRQHHDGQRIQHLQQGIGGVKDVILLGREEEFMSGYKVHNEGSAHFNLLEYVLQLVPRLFLEVLAIAGLAALVITMVLQGRPTEALIPTLGLFGAAAMRLMPLATRVLAGMQRFRYSLPIINTLYREVSEVAAFVPKAQRTPLAFDTSITLRDVGYSYAQSGRVTLRDVSFSVEKGTTVGFVGESGAGKSTLVDTVLGLLTPTSGHVLVDGVDIQQNLRGWQSLVGYVSQSLYLTDDTLRRNVAFGVPEAEIDDAAVDRALIASQLQGHISSLPEGKHTLVGERGIRLSGGQRQRIAIARALYHDPQVLVLDEATSALDNETERSIMELINALHGTKTILIVSHRLTTVERCDRIFRVVNGGVQPEVLVR